MTTVCEDPVKKSIDQAFVKLTKHAEILQSSQTSRTSSYDVLIIQV